VLLGSAGLRSPLRDGTLCEGVWIDPCAGMACTACGARAGYCFPEDEALGLCDVSRGPCDFRSGDGCPERPPEPGSPCGTDGLECHYCPAGDPDRAGSRVDTATCTDAAWDPSDVACGA